MYYIKYKSGPTLIEFSNSFSGKETITVNGIIASEKSSVMGTDHHFMVNEMGQPIRYTLRTKIGGPTMVMIDLIRETEIILRNEAVPYGTRDRQSKQVKEGLKLLKTYDLDGAMKVFSGGLNVDPNDADLHFYKACVHSLLEQAKDSYFHLELAIELGLTDRQKILTEDALAFIRIQDEFATFCERFGIKKPEYL